MSNEMAYRAYTVVKREGEDDFWQPIGAAFAHKDGKGFNVTLQCLPLDGKIVLRVPNDDAPKPRREERRQEDARPPQGRDDRRGRGR
jgi:hypothetical protein